MAESQTAAVTAGDDTEDAGGFLAGRMGRVLDVSAIAAGIVLGIIAFDILSGGKLTRLARGKRGGCGCQDQAQAAPAGEWAEPPDVRAADDL